MQEQDGILNHQKLTRYTFRANSEFDITKNFRIGENMQLTYRQTRLLTGGGGGAGVAQDENNILQAFRMPSIIPVYDAFGGYAGTRAGGFNNPQNPVANLDRQKDNRGFETRLLGNIYLEFEPIKGLVARTSLGGNGATSYFWAYGGRQYENSENNSAVSYSEGSSQFLAWTLTNTLNFKKQFDKHNIDVLLGQEALNTGEGRFISGTGLNPFSEDRDFVTLNNTQPGNTRVVGSDYFKGVNFNSYFGKISYSYNDKYIATFVLRRDGSSRFGAENRYGVFPAFSVGWRIASEDFMKSITWLDDLKIRGGYGVMGNSNNVDPNNQFSLYATSVGSSSYPIDNTGTAASGFYRSRIGNPLAKWERAVTANIGFDGSFLGGKLDVVFDIWQKNTDDLLFQVPISSTNGPNASAPSVNIGKMLNQAIEAESKETLATK
jgi:TonB-dependent starch-binding outer membrane protein SusC